jgi:hypothetical protein
MSVITFGHPVSNNPVSYWGARAIYQPARSSFIDFLHDRQQLTGLENKEFYLWLNNRAIPWLRQQAEQGEITEKVVLKEFIYELIAQPSDGYLHVGVGMYGYKEETPIINPATKKEERVVSVNGDLFVVDKMVPVGTFGTIKANNLGDCEVMGYFEEKYNGTHKLLCLMVLLDNPHQQIMESCLMEDAKVLVKAGKIPAEPHSKYPDQKSKEFKSFKKTWKMRPIPVWPNDFKEQQETMHKALGMA